MKILVLGWEYPPFHSGGLGVATKNLSEALSQDNDLQIYFALPSFVYRKIRNNHNESRTNLVAYLKNFIEVKYFPSLLNSPYVNEKSYSIDINFFENSNKNQKIYGSNLFEEIERYALEMENYCADKDFDLIHAHDWITFQAAKKIKERKNTPVIAHVHATEYDRTGGNPSEMIYLKEKEGLEIAEKILTVSNYTKNILKKHYGIKDEKISVIHNGIEDIPKQNKKNLPNENKKNVLFLGRLVLQKGPNWFLKIAEKVLEKRKDVDFLIAGNGNMLPELIRETITKNLKNHVHFLGFLKDNEREKAFNASDVYVMSSVSEPFGLSAVEAAQRGTPVVLSKQSGVREVLYHSLSADYWDVNKMADNILAILEYPALSKTLCTKSTQELINLTWHNQAQKVKKEYKNLLAHQS